MFITSVSIPPVTPKLKQKNRLIIFGLRGKIALLTLICVALILSATGFYQIYKYEYQLLQNSRAEVRQVAKVATQSLDWLDLKPEKNHQLQLLLNQLSAHTLISYVKLLSHEGAVLAQAGKQNRNSRDYTFLLIEPFTLQQQPAGFLHLELNKLYFNDKMKQYKRQIINDHSFMGALIALCVIVTISLVVFKPLKRISNSLVVDFNETDIPVTKSILEDNELSLIAKRCLELRRDQKKTQQELNHEIKCSDSQLGELQKQLVNRFHELQQVKKELNDISQTDSLTTLYNRKYFDAFLENEVNGAMREKRQAHIVVIEIDHFKNINQAYGSKSGNIIIAQIARVLRSRVPNQFKIFRTSGKKFTLVCFDNTREELLVLAHYLRDAVASNPMATENDQLQVTVCMGASSYPNSFNTESAEDLFQCAEVALHYSKEHSINRLTHFSLIMDHLKKSFPADRALNA